MSSTNSDSLDLLLSQDLFIPAFIKSGCKESSLFFIASMSDIEIDIEGITVELKADE